MGLASDEAMRLRQEYLGTEHILLGITGETAGVATDTLKSFGITRDQVRSGVEKLIGVGPPDASPDDVVPLAERSRTRLRPGRGRSLRKLHVSGRSSRSASVKRGMPPPWVYRGSDGGADAQRWGHAGDPGREELLQAPRCGLAASSTVIRTPSASATWSLPDRRPRRVAAQTRSPSEIEAERRKTTVNHEPSRRDDQDAPRSIRGRAARARPRNRIADDGRQNSPARRSAGTSGLSEDVARDVTIL